MVPKKTNPFLFSLSSLSFRILHEYIREKGMQRGDYSGALNNILQEWFAMRIVADTAEKFRLRGRPLKPMSSLQDEILKIKSRLRGYQPTPEELAGIVPNPLTWRPPDEDER